MVEPLSGNYEQVNNVEVNYEQSSPFTNSNDLVDLLRVSHRNNEEKTMLFKICREYHKDNQDLTFTNQVKHKINTVDDLPIYTKSYRYPYIHKQEVQKQIEDMLKQEIIRPSYSPWSSPVWIVPK